jgi:hypothetical protein
MLTFLPVLSRKPDKVSCLASSMEVQPARSTVDTLGAFAFARAPKASRMRFFADTVAVAISEASNFKVLPGSGWLLRPCPHSSQNKLFPGLGFSGGLNVMHWHGCPSSAVPRQRSYIGVKGVCVYRVRRGVEEGGNGPPRHQIISAHFSVIRLN